MHVGDVNVTTNIIIKTISKKIIDFYNTTE